MNGETRFRSVLSCVFGLRGGGDFVPSLRRNLDGLEAVWAMQSARGKGLPFGQQWKRSDDDETLAFQYAAACLGDNVDYLHPGTHRAMRYLADGDMFERTLELIADGLCDAFCAPQHESAGSRQVGERPL